MPLGSPRFPFVIRPPVLISISILLAFPGVVWAPCPPGPLLQEVANADPDYLAACTPTPTCPTPDAPVLVGTALAQEAVIRATVPDGFTPTRVLWQAERFVSPGVYQLLWTHESIAGISQGAGPYPVDFGAPGLATNATHHFRVTFCNADGCFCWSPRSAAVTTTGFDTTGPAPPPSPVVQKVEDRFQRPATNPKYSQMGVPGSRLGDGLGPDVVWKDYHEQVNIWNGSKIVTNPNAAYIPTNAIACYTPPAAHEHSYADARFGLPASAVDAKYNLDVRLRIHETNSVRGYAAKLVYGPLDAANEPKLKIYRLVGSIITPLASLTLPTATCGAPDPQNPCNCRPPLVPGSGSVWLRGEIEDSDPPVSPIVKATVAWESGSSLCNGAIETCPFVCEIQFTDSSTEGQDMANRTGASGVQAHERPILLYEFSSGHEEP